MDVPLQDESSFRRRVTDAVVRIAEALRQPDDVYNLVYRMPLDEEAVVLPVGPQLQELGERFFLTLNQGVVAGRTMVWLTLGRDTALAVWWTPSHATPRLRVNRSVFWRLPKLDGRWPPNGPVSARRW